MLMPLAVAQYFSDGVAICYVLPVLWMTFFTYYGESVSAETTASIPYVLQVVYWVQSLLLSMNALLVLSQRC